VRAGLGFLGAVELSDDVLAADPGAVFRLQMACRAEGVLVRPLGRGIAVSPPLVCGQEDIDEIGAAIGAGLEALAREGATT
jgi:adenosylmethionine-8-amino-7-oxononanoate aminotransferase